MTTQNGNGQAVEQVTTALEQELRHVNAMVAQQQAADAGLDCNEVGANAAHAVHKCQQAADHIRSMCDELVAIAQTMKATGEALALDIERRAEHFDQVMKVAHEYASKVNETFANERQALSGLAFPEMKAAPKK